MTRTPAWRRYLRFWRPDVDADIDDELRFHLEERVADLMLRGRSREAAEAQAAEEFGDVAAARASLHEIDTRLHSTRRRHAWLEELRQDLRFGTRLLRKSPALVLTAVVVLALGIGVNLAGFNLVNVMFFRPLPVRDPASLVRYTITSSSSSSTEVPYPGVEFYARNATALSAVLAQSQTTMTLGGAGVRSVSVSLVTPNYFAELGTAAALGRLFDPRIDGLPTSAPVAVVGYFWWRDHLGGDPGAIGRTMRLDGRPATIIGVLPERFVSLDPDRGDGSAVWLTMGSLPYFVPDTKLLTSFSVIESGVEMWGRLRPGMSRRAADASLIPISAQLAHDNPAAVPTDFRLLSEPGGYAANLGSDSNSGAVAILSLLAILVLLILVAACANLGNLLLGHAATREREIAIRLSLGASRRRIVRQLLTECLLLASLGSAAGLALSSVVSRPLMLWLGMPANLVPVMDWRVGLLTVMLGAVACALFGFTPARQAASLFRHKSRARTIFMAAQVTGSCVLLVLSTLLVRSLREAVTAEMGFDYRHLVTVAPRLDAHGYDGARAGVYFGQLESRLQQVPGVTAVAEAWVTPLGTRMSVQRMPHGVNLHFNRVSAPFFTAMGISLRRGQTFPGGAQDVCVVSEAAARVLWPGKDPIGQTYAYGTRSLQVIGVVADARVVARRADDAVVYMPLRPADLPQAVVLVRTSTSPDELLASISGAVRGSDASLSPDVATVASLFRERIDEAEKLAACVSGLGLLAMVLATVGLFGVVSYSVSQRAREIGIRVALGATGGTLLGNMLGGFVRPIGISLGAGLLIAAGLSMVLRQQLYGLSNFDAVSYASASIALIMTAGVAALIPARRALKVDPVVALRHE